MTISRERLIELGYVAEPGLTSEDKIEASALAEHDRQVRRAALLEVKQLAWQMATPMGQSLPAHQFINAIDHMAEETEE